MPRRTATLEYRLADCPRCGAVDAVRQTQWFDPGYTSGHPDMAEPPDGGESDWSWCRACDAGLPASRWTRDEERTLITTAGPWIERD